MTHLAAGVVLGIAGSVHCVAMCGPLVGVMSPALGRRLAAAAWYQAGRLAMYVALGVVAGAAGRVMASGFGRGLAIAAGGLMLLTALGQIRGLRVVTGRWMTPLLSRAMEHIARMRGRHPRVTAVGAGAVNGLLPCGLVYAALVAAAATGGVTPAAKLMLAFGVGTLPAMAAVWFSPTLVPAGIRRRLRLVAPLVVAAVALLLIGRGVSEIGRHAGPTEATANGTMHGH